jgi:hypothetical protein
VETTPKPSEALAESLTVMLFPLYLTNSQYMAMALMSAPAMKKLTEPEREQARGPVLLLFAGLQPGHLRGEVPAGPRDAGCVVQAGRVEDADGPVASADDAGPAGVVQVGCRELGCLRFRR